MVAAMTITMTGTKHMRKSLALNTRHDSMAAIDSGLAFLDFNFKGDDLLVEHIRNSAQTAL